MASFPPPPPGTDLTANRGPQILLAQGITFAFAIVGVFLRFVTRHYSGAGFWLDDWLIAVALVFALAIVVLSQWNDHIFGQHVWTVGYEAQVNAMKMALADELLYTVLLGATKLSVLALYWRVFRLTKIRIPILLTVALVIGWVVASIIGDTLQCLPVQKDFNVILPGQCFNIRSFFLANAMINILTDGILLGLPLQPIMKIQKALSQKLMVIGTFVCGGLIVVFSALRLNALLSIDLDSIDLSWNYTDTFIWSAVEVNMAIFSVCLPALRPFCKFLRTGSFVDPGATGNSKASGSFGRAIPPGSNRSNPKTWGSSYAEELSSRDSHV